MKEISLIKSLTVFEENRPLICHTLSQVNSFSPLQLWHVVGG
jgi:hypothetical protein